MSKETLVVVCPNPNCRREITEPIKLKVLSVARPVEYEACPFCFTRLEHEAPTEQESQIEEELPEPTIEQQEEFMNENEDKSLLSEEEKEARAGLLKKVRSLIPRSDEKESKEIEEPEAEPATIEETPEEPTIEPVIKEETKEPPKQEQTAKTETNFPGCKNTFGYLAKRSPDTPIPSECMLCPKIVDCMMLKVKPD